MERHEGMAHGYSNSGKMTGRKMRKRQEMRKHCAGLSEKYAAVAAEYEELAKLHDEEARAE